MSTPNIVCSTSEIPVVEVEMIDLSVSLPKYLYSMKADILNAYEYDLYLQLLLKYQHFQNYISVLTNHDNAVEYSLEEHYNHILLPRQDDNLNYLSNVNSFGSLTYNKTKTFIETKVTAMKLQGFNLLLENKYYFELKNEKKEVKRKAQPFATVSDIVDSLSLCLLSLSK